MRELFVYYRVRSANATRAAMLVREFQARLRSDHPALNARLLRRPEAAGGLVTWMETYAVDRARALDGVGIDQALQARIEAAAAVLRPFLDGERHTEVFVDDSCA